MQLNVANSEISDSKVNKKYFTKTVISAIKEISDKLKENIIVKIIYFF